MTQSFMPILKTAVWNNTFNSSVYRHTNSRGLVSYAGIRISTQVSSIQTVSKKALAGTLKVSGQLQITLNLLTLKL